MERVTPAGVASTYATGLLGPKGLVFGPNGSLYVANNFDGIEEVSPSGTVTEIANGSNFDDPRGIAIDNHGNLYVANSGNGTLVSSPTTGLYRTLATGLQNPQGLAMNASGDLFVANFNDGDGNDGSVTEVTPSGNKSTFVSELRGPIGLAFDAAGNLYVSNNFGDVTKVTPAGATSTLLSGLEDPDYLCIDGAGNLYIAGALYDSNNNTYTDEVLKVTQTVNASFSMGGSAVSGLAYSGVTASPLTFGIGQTSLNITGTLLPDAGPTQTLSFSLDTTTGGADLGDPLVNTMTINEPLVVQFGSASETVSESDGTFSIPVTLSGTPTESASVPFSLGGSAVSGVTFSVTSNPLTFGVGQTTVDITGTLLSDPGPNQTLTLTLDSSATGAVVGPQSSTRSRSQSRRACSLTPAARP